METSLFPSILLTQATSTPLLIDCGAYVHLVLYKGLALILALKITHTHNASKTLRVSKLIPCAVLGSLQTKALDGCF